MLDLSYCCRRCGLEVDDPSLTEWACEECGGPIRGQAPGAIVRNLLWDKPKPIYALRPDHPDYYAYSPDDAKAKLERNQLLTRPDDESGVKSPLGEGRETAKPISDAELGCDPGVHAVRKKIRKIRPKKR